MRGLQERGAVVAALSRRRAGRLAVTAGVMVAVVVVDRVTKWLAVTDLHRPVHVFGPFGLALQYNSGSAFSLFTGDVPVLTAVVIVMVVVLAWLAWRARTTALAAGFGLVLGGALGNLTGRVAGGHHGDVVDFITLSHWPTFNVADACITVGVVLLGALAVWGRPPAAEAARPDAGSDADPGTGTDAGPATAPDAGTGARGRRCATTDRSAMAGSPAGGGLRTTSGEP